MPLPFDIEKAKAGHPLVTRDGLDKNMKFALYNEHAQCNQQVVLFNPDNSMWQAYFADGRAGNGNSNKDLFLADPPKVKRSGVIRLYQAKAFEAPLGVWATNPQLNSEAAKQSAGICGRKESNFLKEITVEWEEPA
jgi:hypothetical protein